MKRFIGAQAFSSSHNGKGLGLDIAKSSLLSSLATPKMSLAKVDFPTCRQLCNALLCTELPIPPNRVLLHAKERWVSRPVKVFSPASPSPPNPSKYYVLSIVTNTSLILFLVAVPSVAVFAGLLQETAISRTSSIRQVVKQQCG
jgi:hypothetical protein